MRLKSYSLNHSCFMIYYAILSCYIISLLVYFKVCFAFFLPKYLELCDIHGISMQLCVCWCTGFIKLGAEASRRVWPVSNGHQHQCRCPTLTISSLAACTTAVLASVRLHQNERLFRPQTRMYHTPSLTDIGTVWPADWSGFDSCRFSVFNSRSHWIALKWSLMCHSLSW